MNRKKDKKYDERGNLVYYNYPGGVEYWYKYDENNNLIHCKNSAGYEYWYKYDENNNEIYYKDNREREHWYMYNKNGKKVNITKQKFDDIEFRKKEKEYNSRTKCSRFEIIDI